MTHTLECHCAHFVLNKAHTSDEIKRCERQLIPGCMSYIFVFPHVTKTWWSLSEGCFSFTWVTENGNDANCSPLSPPAVIHCSSVCEFRCLFTSRQRDWVTDDFPHSHPLTCNSASSHKILDFFFNMILVCFFLHCLLPSCSLSAVSPALLRHSSGSGGALMCRTPPHQWRGGDISVKSAQHNKAHMATSARRWCCGVTGGSHTSRSNSKVELGIHSDSQVLVCLCMFLSGPTTFLEAAANKRGDSYW